MKKFFNWPLIATAMVIAALSTALSASADTPTALYIIGQVNQYTAVEWNPTVGVQMTANGDGTFTADVYCQSATNDFSFATELGSWDVLNSEGGIRRYCSSSPDYWRITTNIEGTSRFDTPIGLVHYDPSNNKKGSFRLDPGCYTINVDLRDASNPTVSVSRKAVTVVSVPRTETVKAGTVVTAQTNLDEFVAATGSGETVTVQLKEGTGDWGNSVTLNNRGLATVFTRASIGSLVVENAMAYNVRSVTALDQKTYTWTDEQGAKHTSSLTDVATNPKQIMALLNKVYTDPEIPGAKTHTEWSPDGSYQYPQIPDGQSNSSYPKSTYQQSQKTINYDTQARVKYDWWESSQKQGNISNIYTSWIDCDKPVPQPNEEGATVLFVQVKDTWHADDILAYYNNGPMTKVDYATRDYTIIKDAIESMQVITNQLRVTDEANGGNNPGNLFLIDNITTSRFYFISKGRVRAGNGSAPLYLTFEQLSPVQSTDPDRDMSEALNSGGVYNFQHDCYDVFRGDKSAAYGNKYIPHYAQLSGFDVSDRDNIEARVLQNLTLFLPDKRFKHPDSGSGNGHLYNYSGSENFTTSPKLLLYKAQLEAEATPSAEEGYYDIKLDWSSWFGADKIQADVKEQFYVYLIDDDGNKALLNDAIAANDNYHCDATLATPTGERTYTYRVKQLKEQQNFTFIVIANPEGSEMFVKTNVARVVVPGNEKFFLDGAKYRSRYQLSE